jgi:hypothetical protein
MNRTGRTYSDDEMRQMWEFVRHDFERLLEFRRWLDGLSDDQLKEQADSLESLYPATVKP